MAKKKWQIVDNLSDAVMKRIRRSQALIAKELPELIEKEIQAGRRPVVAVADEKTR